MNVTTERRIRNCKLQKAHQGFHRAIVAIAADEPIDFAPADDAEDRKLRVLIINGHRTNADTMSSLVAKWGHDIRGAYDGVTGLALAAAYQPDVLLLDMLMSEVSGFEVATQVRRQDRLKHCFIIAITDCTDATYRSRCYEAGVDLLLMKPVATSAFHALLSLESERVKRLNGMELMVNICSESIANY